MVTVNCAVALLELLSVTCTVNVADPAADGTPLTVPVVEARVKPAGKVPAVTAQLL
jgi:hypothetical protein